ncbi:MAG: SH3 domain-containing protein [Anaerolineales bacterium]|nr:SH3 domain-containing protein [Anaerolineales bacterium]MCA9926151.1 SH3 domain-containing protein [Anaerolineales bacterium]
MSEKLREGLELLEAADNNEKFLGTALLSLHAALEDYFRERLAADIAPLEQAQSGRVGWQTLIDLWENRFSLSNQDKRIILAKNTVRNKVAHGDSYTLSRSEMEEYAQFVQDFIGVHFNNPSRRQNRRSQDLLLETAISSIFEARRAKKSQTPVNSIGCKKLVTIILAAIAFVCLCPILATSLILDAVSTSTMNAIEFLVGMDTPTAEILLEEENKTPQITFPPPPTPIIKTPTNGNAMVHLLQTSSAIYSGPGTNFDTVREISNSEIYHVIMHSDDGKWYKIRLSTGQEGWIQASQVVFVSP